MGPPINVSDPFEPNLRARLEVGRTELEGGRLFPVSANIVYVRLDGSVWNWILSDKSFESVHGLYRIVQIVPDKLDTAVQINGERLKDPEDDGAFLVDLVLNLLRFYRDMVEGRRLAEEEDLAARKRRVAKPERALEFVRGPYPPSEDEGEDCALDFEGTLLTFSIGLLQMRSHLKQRSGKKKLRADAKEIMDFLIDLLTCCEVYLGFLHPLWVASKRSGEDPDHEAGGPARRKLEMRVAECRKKIWKLIPHDNYDDEADDDDEGEPDEEEPNEVGVDDDEVEPDKEEPDEIVVEDDEGKPNEEVPHEVVAEDGEGKPDEEVPDKVVDNATAGGVKPE